MKGKNSIKLNAATMREAVQYWLNETQLKERVKVEDVTVYNAEFTIEFNPTEPEAA